MRAVTLGLCALACTVGLVATSATSATAEPRGQRNWNKAEKSGYRDRHRGYGYRQYYGPSVYYGAYYDPYYYAPYPYYYAPAHFLRATAEYRNGLR
jgi:hypothetical protein